MLKSEIHDPISEGIQNDLGPLERHDDALGVVNEQALTLSGLERVVSYIEKHKGAVITGLGGAATFATGLAAAGWRAKVAQR